MDAAEVHDIASGTNDATDARLSEMTEIPLERARELRARERHLFDIYDSLKVPWGSDPFVAINHLKSGKMTIEEARHVYKRAFVNGAYGTPVRREGSFRHTYVANAACIIYDHCAALRLALSMDEASIIADAIVARFFEESA